MHCPYSCDYMLCRFAMRRLHENLQICSGQRMGRILWIDCPWSRVLTSKDLTSKDCAFLPKAPGCFKNTCLLFPPANAAAQVCLRPTGLVPPPAIVACACCRLTPLRI